MSGLEEQMNDIRRELSRIAKEVEKLKEEKVKLSEPQRFTPEPSDSVYQMLEKKLLLSEKHDDGTIFYGGIRKIGGKLTWSYYSYNDLEGVLKCSPKRVAHLLSPFSNEQRITILKTMFEQDRSSSELSQSTGLEGGQLYHHLKELALAEFIEQKERGIYALTEKGMQALLTVLAMTKSIEKRAIPEEIEETFRSEP